MAEWKSRTQTRAVIRSLPTPPPTTLDQPRYNDVTLSIYLIHIPTKPFQQFSDGSASSTFDRHWSEVDEVDQSEVGSALRFSDPLGGISSIQRS